MSLEVQYVSTQNKKLIQFILIYHSNKYLSTSTIAIINSGFVCLGQEFESHLGSSRHLRVWAASSAARDLTLVQLLRRCEYRAVLTLNLPSLRYLHIAWTKAQHALSSRNENVKTIDLRHIRMCKPRIVSHITWLPANSPVLLACEHFVCRTLCTCWTLYKVVAVHRTDLILTNTERCAVQMELDVKSYKIKDNAHFSYHF